MSPPVPPALHELLHAASPAARDEAWGTFVTEHSRLLLKVASAKRTGYDATMDRYTFILDKLREHDCRRLRGYQPREARFSTWLVVVARRLCSDFDRERYGKIWDVASGGVVYDNQMGTAEDSDAATTLGGGSIVIHR